MCINSNQLCLKNLGFVNPVCNCEKDVVKLGYYYNTNTNKMKGIASSEISPISKSAKEIGTPDFFIAPELRELEVDRTDYRQETQRLISEARQTNKILDVKKSSTNLGFALPPPIINANGQIIETIHIPTKNELEQQELLDWERNLLDESFETDEMVAKKELENERLIDLKVDENLYQFYSLPISERQNFINKIRQVNFLHGSNGERAKNRILWETTKLDNFQNPNYYKADLLENIDQVKFNIGQIVKSKVLSDAKKNQLIIREVDIFKTTPEYQKIEQILNSSTSKINEFELANGLKKYNSSLKQSDFDSLEINIKNKKAAENILVELNLRGLLIANRLRPVENTRYIPTKSERAEESRRNLERIKLSRPLTESQNAQNKENARLQKEKIDYSEIVVILKSTLEFSLINVIEPKASFERNFSAIKRELNQYKNSKSFERMESNYGKEFTRLSLKKYIKSFMAIDYAKRIGLDRDFKEFNTEPDMGELENYRPIKDSTTIKHKNKFSEIAFMPVEVAISAGIDRLTKLFTRKK
jgi:hypothetical protein